MTATGAPVRTARRNRADRRRAAFALPLLLALAGCAVLDDVPQPPGPAATDFVPAEVAPSLPEGANLLSPDGFDTVMRMAVRIRNEGCTALSTGSGFAIDATTLITNRHVVTDSEELQVSTYDGRDITVTAASTAAIADLALVRTAEALPDHPELAEADPEPGDAVQVVGYPQGGTLTVTNGRVLATTTDPLNEALGDVMLTDAPVEPGSSGSAVLDEEGRVVGVVYAKNARGQSYIVPVSSLRALLEDSAAFTPTIACAPAA